MLTDCRGRCGKTEPGDDWLRLTIETTPGRRTDTTTSLVTTVTTDFFICPECVTRPQFEAIRDALADEFAVSITPAQTCVVVCRRPHRAWRLTTRAQIRWRARSGRVPADAVTRCPECSSRARTYLVGEVVPGRVARVLALIGRPADRARAALSAPTSPQQRALPPPRVAR